MNHLNPEHDLGHSGACVFLTGLGNVCKVGDYGVAAQGHYMRILGPEVCPWVHSITGSSYIMERLWPLRSGQQTISEYIKWIHLLLEVSVWCRPAAIPQSWSVRAFTQWAPVPILELFQQAYPDPGIVPEVLTHGDPTIANLMLNSAGTFRLLDPIPPKDRVPSWRDVDRGKLLQSWLGWETLIAASSTPISKGGGPVMEDLLVDARAWLWCAIHLQRILPYAKNQSVTDWCNLRQAEALLRCRELLG